MRVNRCKWCGLKHPALFIVPNDVWKHYIGEHPGGIICLECWGYLTTMTDGGRYEDEHGGPFGFPLHLDSVSHSARHYMRGIARAPRVRGLSPAAVAQVKRGFDYTDGKPNQGVEWVL